MRAITVKQPHAWAAAAGHKPFENRSWTPPDDLLGQTFAIHAGLKVDEEALGYYASRFNLRPEPHWLVTGAIVALAVLEDVVVQSLNPWFEDGGYGWRLRDVRPLVQPVPCRGFQGLWTVDPELEPLVLRRAQARAA